MGGFINRFGAGQSSWARFLRSRPKIKEAFSQIYGTDQLCASFQGGNVFRPYALNPEWKTKGGWYHVDQNGKSLPGKQCVQGFVCFRDATKETGGLCVLPKSHLQHT